MAKRKVANSVVEIMYLDGWKIRARKGRSKDLVKSCTLIFFEHNRTPSGKKTVIGVQVVTASQVPSIECNGRSFHPRGQITRLQ